MAAIAAVSLQPADCEAKVRRSKRTALPGMEARRSVVVGVRADAGHWRGHAEPLASQLQVRGLWPESGSPFAAATAVRCDLCAASAAGAQPGQQNIVHIDLRAITNRLTTLQIADTTVKLTSLSPLGLQIRKPF